MKTNFHNKNFALRLALKMRQARTRKWAIMDMKTLLKDRLVRTRIPNNVERVGQTGLQLHSTFAKTKEMLNGC